LDPSLSSTGYGLIRAEGNRLTHIANGQLKTDARESLAQRLAHLATMLDAILADHHPHSAAAEEIFLNKNPQSTLKLAQARGVVLMTAARSGIDVAEYAARLVKKAVVGTGADLLWRAKANMKPRYLETLTDGSWLGELRPSGNAGRHSEPLTIRVIDYTIDDGRPNEQTYRLFTTILDPNEASAVELAVAYAQRWEIEGVFDELKTHQRGARMVLRSKSPDLVRQEIWGHLCCHYAIRTLMWEAADHADVDPDRVSFVAALRIARRSITAARDFSPSRH